MNPPCAHLCVAVNIQDGGLYRLNLVDLATTGCNSYMVAPTCSEAESNAQAAVAIPEGGKEVWKLIKVSSISDEFWYVQSTVRSAGSCNSYLSFSACNSGSLASSQVCINARTIMPARCSHLALSHYCSHVPCRSRSKASNGTPRQDFVWSEPSQAAAFSACCLDA